MKRQDRLVSLSAQIISQNVVRVKEKLVKAIFGSIRNDKNDCKANGKEWSILLL